jgi:hypothetical protein
MSKRVQQKMAGELCQKKIFKPLVHSFGPGTPFGTQILNSGKELSDNPDYDNLDPD